MDKEITFYVGDVVERIHPYNGRRRYEIRVIEKYKDIPEWIMYCSNDPNKSIDFTGSTANGLKLCYRPFFNYIKDLINKAIH